MKKKLLAVFAAAAVAGSTLAAFAACANNNAQGGMGGAGTAVQQRARDAYGIGAVTTAKLLSDISPVATVKSASAVLSDGGDGKQVAGFDKYFQTLDTFLNEDAIKTNVEDNFDEAYPYDYKLTVNGSDLDGTGVTYTMYYSEQVLTVESEYDDDDPDEEETLEAYSLEGVMVLEGVAYNLFRIRDDNYIFRQLILMSKLHVLRFQFQTDIFHTVVEIIIYQNFTERIGDPVRIDL